MSEQRPKEEGQPSSAAPTPGEDTTQQASPAAPPASGPAGEASQQPSPTPPPASAVGGAPERPHPRRPEGSQEKPSEPGLNEQGEATASLLRRALSALDIQVDGREDEPVVMVAAQDIQQACQICKNDLDLHFDFLRCLSVVDYSDHFQVVYHLFSYTKRHKVVLKANVDADDPRLPSVISVWRGADWYEREGHDLFGVVFEGHPNLAPLLLYEGFEGYPMRKSFPFHDYEEW